MTPEQEQELCARLARAADSLAHTADTLERAVANLEVAYGVPPKPKRPRLAVIEGGGEDA